MKRTLIPLLLLALLPAVAAADKLRIGTEGAYPPFNTIDKNGQVAGFDVDIARALCAEMKAECSFVTQDWDGIIPGLLARKYDAIVASMSITEERKRAVAFTDAYYSNSLSLIAREGATIDTAKLGDYALGAQRATIAADHAGKLAGDDAKLYDTQENAYLDLASGRIDVLVTDTLPGYDWLQSPQGKGFAFVGDKIDIDDKIGIALRKGDDDLRKRFNAALKAIVDNGTYAEINARYFPFSIY
jgi:polar amino acid transport system substrate-binding protein